MTSITTRPDLSTIADWIQPESRVLDLGCGDGTLLAYLLKEKRVTGYGLEIEDESVTACIHSGVNVIQTDINQGLSEFDDNSFDYVLLSLTLQAMSRPDLLMKEMMRVGTEGIVTFPNFGYWKARLQLALLGRMPFTRTLPHQWYDTPNIHLCTFKDFELLCKKLGFSILERRSVDHDHKSSLGPKLFPKFLGEIALYRFKKST